MGLGEDPPTSIPGSFHAGVVLPVSYRPRRTAQHEQSMGYLCFIDRPTLVPCGPSSPNRLVLAELQLCPDACSVGCALQHHGSAAIDYHGQYLPRGRSPAVSARQSGFDWHQLYEYGLVRADQDLLHAEKSPAG